MAAITNPIHTNEVETKFDRHFVVVHPLDDLPEEKVNVENLGPMPMTRSVRLSLMSLRGYLVLMMILVLYHVLTLAGIFGH
jgi:hypothetical protein